MSKRAAVALGSLGGSRNTPAQARARLGNLKSKPVRSLFITGATGTVGTAVIEYYLGRKDFDRIVVFSRDEHKQVELRRKHNDGRLRFFLGDVRDPGRLQRAMEGVDTVVHCAALKHIDAATLNPHEAVKTNVDGSVNVIDAALDNNVRRVVAISTDKAVEPTCLYGATKLTMESIVLHAKAYAGHRRTTFAVVRMGNIAHSRGSVIPYFNALAALGKSLPITHLGMTRYWVEKEQVQELVAEAIGGEKEVYLPKPVAFRLSDLVAAYGLPHTIIGLRDGEKMHEKLSPHESSHEPVRFLTVGELRAAIHAG